MGVRPEKVTWVLDRRGTKTVTFLTDHLKKLLIFTSQNKDCLQHFECLQHFKCLQHFEEGARFLFSKQNPGCKRC